MKNIIFLLLPVLIFLNACSKKDPSFDAVLIRIKNSGTFNYENVVVNTGGGENNYGSIPSGQFSEYKEFTSAYRYAYIRLEINGQTALLQPFDYVGETPLENGKYTYVVTADGTSGSLGLVFKED
jgi:hypothetical protein